MITPDHVRNLMAGGDVVLMWMDGGGAVVVEIARCCSIDGWVVAVPEELEPPNEPEQLWYEQIAAELSDRCAMRGRPTAPVIDRGGAAEAQLRT